MKIMLLQMPVGRIQVCLAQDVNVLPWEHSGGEGGGISFPPRLLLQERENATSHPCPESAAPGLNPDWLQDPLHPWGFVLTRV